MEIKGGRPSHSLIICSRNRPDSLLATLQIVLQQEKTVQLSEIILVLNLSDDAQFSSLLNKVDDLPYKYFKIMRTEGGLPSARNKAVLQIANTDITHFIDDDVTIGSNYFIQVENLLSQNLNISGGAPIDLIALDKSTKIKLSRIKHYLGMIPEPGRISKSMRNYWGPVSNNVCVEVDWLPGLAMFFRTKILRDNLFYEKLETFKLGGYGLGEDLIFTLGLTVKGHKLYGVPSLEVHHVQLPNITTVSKKVAYTQGQLKRELVSLFPERFSRTKYLLSLLLEGFLVSVKFPNEIQNNFRNCFEEIRGFW